MVVLMGQVGNAGIHSAFFDQLCQGGPIRIIGREQWFQAVIIQKRDDHTPAVAYLDRLKRANNAILEYPSD
jgi:epoxyqueuosine reductase QueG